MAGSPSVSIDARFRSLLESEIEGEVYFDSFNRGRYSTDASIYQVDPIGVVIPKTEQDFVRAVEIAIDHQVPMLPRGGGTSQCGQTVNEALIIDCSRYLNAVLEFQSEQQKVLVQPGVILDKLNAFLKPHGLFFPIDISTASRATIGGMAANNSCGARSIHYGIMVDNVSAIDGMLSTGEHIRFEDIPANFADLDYSPRYLDIIQTVRDIGRREQSEIENRFPKMMRRVGGYNLDTIDPSGHNMAKLLVGSEGTLAAFKRIELKLQVIPRHRVMGVCHFPTFYAAMNATQHIVRLMPTAVELIDRTMIELAKDIPIFRPVVGEFVKGTPDALLLVEFSGEELDPLKSRLKELDILMSDLGFVDSIVEAIDPDFQARITEVRQQGLNIMMSMKSAGKPVSFIEDCAVPLENLADYTDRLTKIFQKHGTNGTWYAHASVGCLHVRPILNMKEDTDVKKMRAIAEEAFEMVRQYKGSHSGEHGDGIVRSEFHEAMFGRNVVNAFTEIKKAFDPTGLMNPGRIVESPKMDDRNLFRYKPGYQAQSIDTVLDWSGWVGGISGAAEMCNNNGACRKMSGGTMCPSYRVSQDEKHVTRGRANTLRLALSGQLGPNAFSSKEMMDTMDLCVACKGCKRECPTGVDMARLKIEVKHAFRKRNGLSIRDKLIGHLPKYAESFSRFHFVFNLRDKIPGLPWISEKLIGFSANRPLPVWNGMPFKAHETSPQRQSKSVVLMADTFNTFFEPQNLRSAVKILERAGYFVNVIEPSSDERKRLCCGRTYLAAGMVAEAKKLVDMMVEAYTPYVEAGIPIIGLEPSCLYTLRDEFMVLKPGKKTKALADNAMMFEEFLMKERVCGRLDLSFQPLKRSVLLHGHCHQKAFAGMPAVEGVLRFIPELNLEVLNSSCCGMAGSFGYEAEHYEISRDMAELDLMPAIRAANPDALVVADGTSCRHQIHDAQGRKAYHVAQILEMALV